MNRATNIFALTMLSLAAVSCNSDKSTPTPDNDSIIKDSIILVHEAGSSHLPVKQSDDREDPRKNAELTGVQQSQTSNPQNTSKPNIAPLNQDVDEGHPTADANNGVSPSYKTELMNRLRQLDEQANQLMAHVEVLNARQKMIQEQGVQTNPDDQLDLRNTIDALVDIRNEQIALAKKLGDKQMEEDYTDKAAKLYEIKRHTLNH